MASSTTAIIAQTMKVMKIITPMPVYQSLQPSQCHGISTTVVNTPHATAANATSFKSRGIFLSRIA
jgi:hypothetical protein